MALCMDEKDYDKLLSLLKNELVKVEKILDGLHGRKLIGNMGTNIQLYQNVQFELQILIHTLTEYPQFDEYNGAVIVNMTDLNKDRLLGFLLKCI